MKAAPNWVDRTLFPFTSRWMNIDHDHALHYIDEGHGKVILFLHGTPDWCFGFRELIRTLSNNFRCIAPDMLGFGLSDKPAGEDYRCSGHAYRLRQFIERLQLSSFTLLATDFGGGIGLHYAVENRERIDALILYNTWCWPLNSDAHYARPAKWMNTWWGKVLYLEANFPVNVLMPAAYGNRRKLTRVIHAHYKKALPDRASRVGTLALAREILTAGDWWGSINAKLSSLRGIPCLLFWGLKDKLVPAYELEKWRAIFPEAPVLTYADAGHFVHEEKGREMTTSVTSFLRAIFWRR